MHSFSSLEQRVRVQLCYAHVFGEAPTVAELASRCEPGDHLQVERKLHDLEVAGKLRMVDGRCHLVGWQAGASARSASAASWSLPDALKHQRIALSLLERSSLVRMLAVSGSLAGNGPRHNGQRPVDLDLFIITAPDGLHIVRLALRAWGILQSARAALRLGAKTVVLCPNYITDGRFLEVTNESVYTASDSLRVKILKGDEEYRRFLRANSWIQRYYPHGSPPEGPLAEPETAPVLRSALNLFCFTLLRVSSWVKARLTGGPNVYSFGFRFDRQFTFRRAAPAGGGYQPQVARRFSEIYRTHFGDEPGLIEFLFPGTTETGVVWSGGHAAPFLQHTLSYDE